MRLSRRDSGSERSPTRLARVSQSWSLARLEGAKSRRQIGKSDTNVARYGPAHCVGGTVPSSQVGKSTSSTSQRKPATDVARRLVASSAALSKAWLKTPGIRRKTAWKVSRPRSSERLAARCASSNLEPIGRSMAQVKSRRRLRSGMAPSSRRSDRRASASAEPRAASPDSDPATSLARTPRTGIIAASSARATARTWARRAGSTAGFNARRPRSESKAARSRARACSIASSVASARSGQTSINPRTKDARQSAGIFARKGLRAANQSVTSGRWPNQVATTSPQALARFASGTAT